jgi:hypothetical protein
MNPDDQFGQNQYPNQQPAPPQWPASPTPQPQQWQNSPAPTPSEPEQQPVPQQYSMPDMSHFSSVEMAMPEEPAANSDVPISSTTPQPSPTMPKPPADHAHPMVVLQPGERIVAQIKRHPYGIVGNYISGGLIVVLAAAAAVFLVPHVTQDSTNGSQLQAIAFGIVVLLAVGVAAMLAIASKIYWQNEWIVTSDSITQISQFGLFTRQSAQLSMENLEDVTVDQSGLVQHSLNFGTLHVETAGEHSKFVFPYCPNPTYYARLILEAREDYINHKQYEERMHP